MADAYLLCYNGPRIKRRENLSYGEGFLICLEVDQLLMY